MDFNIAAKHLEETGMDIDLAKLVIRKYALNPGYQLCYTIGLRRFLDLWRRYGLKEPPKFVQTILNQGEILFTDLERKLRMTKN
jgi:hypothetical protein